MIEINHPLFTELVELASSASEDAEMAKAATATGFLPINISWGGMFMLTASGEVVDRNSRGEIVPVTDDGLRDDLLRSASALYPNLISGLSALHSAAPRIAIDLLRSNVKLHRATSELRDLVEQLLNQGANGGFLMIYLSSLRTEFKLQNDQEAADVVLDVLNDFRG